MEAEQDHAHLNRGSVSYVGSQVLVSYEHLKRSNDALNVLMKTWAVYKGLLKENELK